MQTQVSFQKRLWVKIRAYQQLNDIDNETLAEQLLIKPRTLYDYDKDAGNIKLCQINNYLQKNNISLDDLLKS